MPFHELMSAALRPYEPLRPHEAFYLEYLSFWVRFVVRRRKPLVIGITGSVGKTTTRETIAAVLKESGAEPIVGSVLATPRNMNTNWGVALTILGYRSWIPRWNSEFVRALTLPARALRMAMGEAYPQVLILEFAAGRASSMERTTALVPLDIGAVTAVGPAHLDTFGTVERVAEIKGAVVRAVPPSGLVILGADNALASAMDRYAKAPVVKVPGTGRALSEGIARVIADHLGLPPDLVDRALAKRVEVKGRQEVIRLGESTVMNDAFNANPLSMAHGLETLADHARPGQRRVAVLGEMAELGEEAERYHREVAATARACADVVVGVGPLARPYEPDHWFETSEDCAEALSSLVNEGDYVLVKGSRSSRLGLVVDALKSELAPSAASV